MKKNYGFQIFEEIVFLGIVGELRRILDQLG